MQEGFGRSDRKVVSFLPGVSPGDVDGRERGVEREGQSLLVARLAVSEPREQLGIAEDELQLEPCPVDVEDITGGERQVCREEHLPGLSLLVSVQIVNDDDTHFTPKADCPNICRIEFVDEFAIDRALFFEDAHIKVLEINFSCELLRTASLPGLRATIEILQVHVITEAAYDVEAKSLDSRNEASLEKYASATMRLQMDNSCLLMRDNILRYQPVRESLSHERPHLAIWVKFMRPEDVRKSSMVSMMNVRKDLLKFVMLERAAAIISLSWIRGLVFIQVTSCVVTTKLLKSSTYPNFSSIIIAFF